MTRNKENLVKLVIVFGPQMDEEGPRGESPWGEVIEANEGGGLYKVRNDCTLVPLQVGDIVTAQLAGDSRLQVTGIQSLVTGAWSAFSIPEDADDAEVVRVGNGLIALGAVSASGGMGQLTVCWSADISVDQVWQLIRANLNSKWELILLTAGDMRLQDVNSRIQYELVVQDPDDYLPIDYWAPEDPEWQKLGIREPDMLAYIQGLAVSDPRVLATIKAGLHGNVLKYLGQISAFQSGDYSGPDISWLTDPEGW